MINRNHSDFEGHSTHWYRYVIRTWRCMHFIDADKNTKNWIVSHNQLNRPDIPQLQEESSPIQFVMKLKFKAYESMTAISILITMIKTWKTDDTPFIGFPFKKAPFPWTAVKSYIQKIPNFNLHTKQERKLNFKHYKISCW